MNGLLEDYFVLHHRLGEGWSAETWSATIKVERYGLPVGSGVALKIYKSGIFGLADNVVQRIEREAQRGSLLHHDNLVTVFELLRSISYEGSQRWILVMELCNSYNLGDYISVNWPLTGDATFNIASAICGGLTSMHSNGAIHRDIKPENVLMTDGGKPKIGDFGVIGHVDELTITGGGEFLGTIRYSAQEVLVGNGADQRSDIYSYGALLFYMLYGKKPFSDIDMFSKLILEISKRSPVIPVEKNRFGVDITLEHLIVESICIEALEHDPSKRPTAAQLINTLEQPLKSEHFAKHIANFIRISVNENINIWKERTGKSGNLLLGYACMLIAHSMSGPEIISTLQGNAKRILEENPRYMDWLLIPPRADEAYLNMPLFIRRSLVCNLDSVAMGYIHEIWDDFGFKHPRARAVRNFATEFMELETDEELKDALQRISVTQYFSGLE